MLRPPPSLRSTPSFPGTCGQSINACRQLTASLRYSSFPSPLGFRHSQSISIRCNSKSNNDHQEYSDQEFLQASILLSETARHHRMLKHGFRDETIWQSSAQKFFPFSAQAMDSRDNVSSIGSGFLRRFQSPTIFLKSSCDGDYVLPIIVGEFSVQKLITEDESWACPNQYQLIKDLVEKLGYKLLSWLLYRLEFQPVKLPSFLVKNFKQVMMVRITERVLKTYFARIIFCNPEENDILSIDARPSDAINVANRCKAPIYVNKRIVLTDGILFSFGMGRIRDSKSTYDVLLDSAADGPDLFAEELELVKNINLAVREERYEDADSCTYYNRDDEHLPEEEDW